MNIPVMNSLLIVNANVAICPAGTEITRDSATVVVGPAVAPDLPASTGDYAISAPWERLGRIGDGAETVSTDTTTINACEDNGLWSEEPVDLSVTPTFRLRFVDVSTRVFQFMFGLTDGTLDNADGGQPWTAPNGMKTWLYIRLNDHRATGNKRLLHGRIFGTLRLTTPPNIAKEIATAEFEFTPDVGVALNSIVPLSLPPSS